MRFDFQFFERMSPEEARTFKERFLALGAGGMQSLIADAKARGVDADFSLSGIVPMFEWLSTLMATTPRGPDPSVPEWIRTSPNYAKNAFDFQEPSKTVILQAAYCLGESFVKTYPSLRWAVGAPGTAEEGQPVVTGFRDNVEMSVLLVTTNLFARVVVDPSKRSDIKRAVDMWRASAAPEEMSSSR